MKSVGFRPSDSILLTLARRLGRLLRAQDTLARIGGDTFAMILISERDPERILALAELVPPRRLRRPSPSPSARWC